MKRIDEDIASGQFKNIYLLHGEEDYLKLQYRNKLLAALVNEGDNMNFTQYRDANINVNQVIDQAETMPFFAEHRVILIENSYFGKKIPEELGDYLSEIPEFTIFIFVEPATDKKGEPYKVDKRGKLYKTADKLGRSIEMKMPNEEQLFKWVYTILKKSNKQIKRDAWIRFRDMTDSCMDNMKQELEKLINYVGDRPNIEVADVEAVCITQIETKVFEMINSIALKDLSKTMELYHDMLAAKEPPMKILYLIVGQFKQLAVIKSLKNLGDNAATISRKTGMKDYFVKKNEALIRNLSLDEINNLLEDAASFEKQVKTGLLDEKLSVELLMMKYAGK